MIFPITTISATLIGIIFVGLSARVVDARRSAGVNLGDGGDETLIRRMRGQANMAEYGPIGLFLLFVAESHEQLYWATLILAVLFVFSRAIHGFAFAYTKHWSFGRFYGTVGTFTAICFLILINLYAIVLYLI